MKYFILPLLLACVAGCSAKTYRGHSIEACHTKDWANGYGYWHQKDLVPVVCIPCTQAVSPEARFVCFGSTDGAKP